MRVARIHSAVGRSGYTSSGRWSSLESTLDDDSLGLGDGNQATSITHHLLLSAIRRKLMIKTNAVRALDKAAISYELRSYDIDEADLSAERAASKLGMEPET